MKQKQKQTGKNNKRLYGTHLHFKSSADTPRDKEGNKRTRNSKTPRIKCTQYHQRHKSYGRSGSHFDDTASIYASQPTTIARLSLLLGYPACKQRMCL